MDGQELVNVFFDRSLQIALVVPYHNFSYLGHSPLPFTDMF